MKHDIRIVEVIPFSEMPAKGHRMHSINAHKSEMPYIRFTLNRPHNPVYTDGICLGCLHVLTKDEPADSQSIAYALWNAWIDYLITTSNI